MMHLTSGTMIVPLTCIHAKGGHFENLARLKSMHMLTFSSVIVCILKLLTGVTGLNMSEICRFLITDIHKVV